MTPALQDALLRVARANELFVDLKDLMAAYGKENEDRSLIKVEGLTLSAIWPPEPPPMFGVRIGEIVHNLRAALDYLVFQLAILDSGSEQQGTQFPIESTADGFRKNVQGFYVE